jgi:hypothetical protein
MDEKWCVRLLSYYTLIREGEYFRYVCQLMSEDYMHCLNAALNAGEWGEDMHILSLSVGLRREIHAYNNDPMSSHLNHLRITQPLKEKHRPLNIVHENYNHFDALIPKRYYLSNFQVNKTHPPATSS